MLSILKKTINLLTRAERKRLVLLFGLMAISGIIEVAGIASILPFLSLITNAELIQKNKYLFWLYNNLNFHSTNRFLIFIGFAVLAILIISNVFVFLTQFGLSRFSWMRNYAISRRLFSSYLYQPYVFFLNRNTTVMGKNILTEVQQVIKGIFSPFLQFFSQGIVAIFIFALLLYSNPVLAIILVVVLGGIYMFVYRLIRNKIYNIGKRRFLENAEQFKSIGKAFGDIKLLKLTWSEKYFIDDFSKHSREFARSNSTNQIIGYIPRYIMEIIAFGGIIIVILYLLATKKSFEEFLPLVGLYAFATYRLMPALQSIFAGITEIRFNTQVLETLYKDINLFNDVSRYHSYDKSETKTIKLKKEIKLENIVFSYPGASESFINNLNLVIKVNTTVGFVGTTGAGKTTVANIILGLLKPEKGRLLVDDIEVNNTNLFWWQHNLGYIPQDIYLQDDTVTSNIAFGISEDEIDLDALENAAKIANIHDFIISELPLKYNTVIGDRGIRLSGGQRQRIGIARALYHDPNIIILDEATSSLDGTTEKEVFDAILNLSITKTLIIIAHRLTTIQECDVIYVFEKGQIIGIGKYNELIKSNQKFKKLTEDHFKNTN